MNYFVRQADNNLEYGYYRTNFIEENHYGIIEFQIEDLIFSTYMTWYGRPGDFSFSMKTGLDLLSFFDLYNRMEIEHFDFLKCQLPKFMNLVLNTAKKGSNTDFFDKPFTSAIDIENERTYSWPIKYKILIKKPLKDYLLSHIIPMLRYAVKLMIEIYNFSDIPMLSKNNILSTEGYHNKELVQKAYNLLIQKYAYL